MNFKLIRQHSQSEKLIAINPDFIKEISMDVEFSFRGLSDFEIERLSKELGEMFNQRVWQLNVRLDEAELRYITLIIKNDDINICHRIELGWNLIEDYLAIQSIRECFESAQNVVLSDYLEQLYSPNSRINPKWSYIEKEIWNLKENGII